MKLRSIKSNGATRSRLLALVSGAALVAVLVPATFATTTWATVTGYAEGTADNNNAETWGDDCTKIAPGGSTFVLEHDYRLVIVKAGSDVSTDGHANTLFEGALAGETVWADSNGSGEYDDDDKGISHIILCGPKQEESEPPSEPPPSEPPSTPPSEPPSTPPSTPPSDTPSGSVGTETEVPSSSPSDGGVEGETDVPEGPSTDIGGNTAGPGNSLPLLLVVLGIIGLAAVVLTPARNRRR
jgi:hypothetical protein